MPTVFPTGFAHAAWIRREPLNTQESLERPSGNLPLSIKRPLVSPQTAAEHGASSTHLSVNRLASVAPAQHNPAQPPPSPMITPSVGTESTGTDGGDSDGDGRARTDGLLRRDGRREDVIATRYVRHTDAGEVRVAEQPPLYNELKHQG